MIQYPKLAILLFRTSGMVMILYTVPMLLWGVLNSAAGATTASNGATNLRSIIYAWGIYAAVGAVTLILARPLGHVAAKGLEDSLMPPPAA